MVAINAFTDMQGPARALGLRLEALLCSETPPLDQPHKVRLVETQLLALECRTKACLPNLPAAHPSLPHHLQLLAKPLPSVRPLHVFECKPCQTQ
jgi:hypothetical protein